MKVRTLAAASVIFAAAGSSYVVAAQRPATPAKQTPKKIDAVVLSTEDLLTARTAREAFAPGVAIAYVARNDVWLYNTTTKVSRQLTADGDARIEVMPRFRGRNAVTYVVDNQVLVYDLLADHAHVLASVPSSVAAYDIDPAGSMLAIIYDSTDTSSGISYRFLRLVDLASHVVKTIPFGGSVPSDQCGDDNHETHVTFSHDGSRMLVEDTTVDSRNKSLFVFDAHGRQVVAPMSAVWARWIPGTRSFIARGYVSMSWFTTDTVTGLSDVYALPREARRPLQPRKRATDARFPGARGRAQRCSR